MMRGEWKMLGLGGESVMLTPVCAKSFVCAPDCGMGLALPRAPSDSQCWVEGRVVVVLSFFYGCYLIFICSRYKRAHETSSYGALRDMLWFVISFLFF